MRTRRAIQRAWEEPARVLLLSAPLEFKVPVHEVLDKRYNVEVTETGTHAGGASFSGKVTATIIYKAPPDPSGEGTLHYREEIFDFGGLVKIKQAQKGDPCRAKKATVVDSETFFPLEKDPAGNIITAKLKLLIDISLEVKCNLPVPVRPMLIPVRRWPQHR